MCSLKKICFVTGFCLLGFAASSQFWGAKQARPIDTPKDSLKRGDFTWSPELSPAGPIVVLVNLDEQFAYTYRNGVLIGVATVSTGKKGHETPTGVFVTTYKDKNHRSKKYNNAPMPYTQRFTMSGIALHAGGIPKYPSSHGCVHLPSEYARMLFETAPVGMTVVVTDARKNPEELSHPAFLNPVYTDGKAQPHDLLGEKEVYRWKPEKSPSGPVSIVVSASDKRMVVLRNGIEIGRSRISLKTTDSLGTHFYIAQLPNDGNTASPQIRTRWLSMPLKDLRYNQTSRHPFIEYLISIPGDFTEKIAEIFEPGTHMLVTDAPILAGSTGKKMAILSSHPDEKPGK